ncbi:MAG TPA: cytochrome b/b6 domain-containing protein, partial [Gammaproteobacteria bacterium]|nr:cytochrome b/b6 domain-containing protein [Gammaproteobacteria bacterium]
VSLERLILLARHKSIGITIFVLMLLRLAWRLYTPAPPLPAATRPLIARAAHVSHALLYVLLLLLPPIGWLLSSASNLSVSWFGLLPLPNLVAPDKALAGMLLTAHQSMAWLLLAVVCVHAGAAFWHHLVCHDTVLSRMLPFTGASRSDGARQ